MGLFFSSDRFTRPGPGVRPDAPRKKGVARLAEIMGRDMWNFFRAGFLAFLGCLPFIIGMFFAVETHALLFMLLAGIIGGLIAGPELSAMADTVLRSLRDEPGYWWETYRRVWKRNARESLVPGMLTGLVLSMQIFTLFHMSVISAGIVTWVLLILSFVVTLGLESYIWPQIALLDLPLYGILKNSLLLFLGYLPRSLGAIAIKAVYWGAILLFFPLTTIILPFTNFWLPMLPALLCIYQPLNKCFTMVGSWIASQVPNSTMGSFSVFMTFLLGVKFIVKPVMTTKNAMEAVDPKKRFVQSVICGVMIGFICGFIGAGGGMMMLLILTSVLGYELKTAVGTSVFIMTFTAFTGAVSHFAIGGMPNLWCLVFCVGSTLLWARIAARFANKASPATLNRATGVVLVVLGVAIMGVNYIK